jgi:FAD/FMN-containing dehydrogenase
MARSTVDWEALQGVIAGEIALPGSGVYEQLPPAFNARFHHLRPQAVVLCATPQDVSETISFLRRNGLEHATRSGGHSFAGHSSTHGVLIDVTRMSSISVSGDVATVGAGARLGEVYEALQVHDVAIPAGTCPPVGMAGLTLGGGLGILGRTHGVTSDRLIRAQVVLADGRILECDEHHDPDLFWALRGAGSGNFGVVTSFTFRTVPAPAVTNFHLSWPQSRAVDLIGAWQGWAPSGPDELAASLKVTATGDLDRPSSVDVYGAFLGTESDAAELIDGLVVRARSEPTSASVHHMSFPETRRFWAQLGVEDEHGDEPQPAVQPHLFARSEFFRRPLPTEAIAALVETFSGGRASGESRELDFMPWGGAYNRVRPEATAFVHRDELFQLKHAAVAVPDASPGEREAAQRWATRSWGSVHPWGSGRVFQNFADPDLEEWADAYYGTNLGRLVQVKARYDPDEFFRFHQSLPAR